MIKSIFSIVLSMVLFFAGSFTVYGRQAEESFKRAYAKIDSELMDAYDNYPKEEQYVYIWYKDLNEDTIDKLTSLNCSITYNEIVEADSKIPSIDYDLKSFDESRIDCLIQKHIDETRQTRQELSRKIDEYSSARRAIARELYFKMNKNNEEDCNLSQEETVYTSRYSPVTIARLTFNRAIEITKSDNVLSVEYRGNDEKADESLYGVFATDISIVHSTYGLTGEGINVGMTETEVVGSHTELSSANITNLATRIDNSNEHPTNVARIIVGSNGVAPNCHLFSIAHSTHEEEIESLITEGVYVINMSAGYQSRNSGDYYDSREKWTDHIASQHHVLLVKSSGNNGNNLIVTSPGLAYNVLTVGNYLTNNSNSKDDDSFDTSSRGGNGGQSGCAKPDIIAPGEEAFGSGTSYAAPFVTGTIALMFEYKAILKLFPALTKAVLTASCERKFTESIYNGLTPNEGAGAFNAKRAIQVLAQGRYKFGTFYSSDITQQFVVTSSDTKITIGLSWLRINTIASLPHNSNSNVNVGIYANLKLQVFLPNNSSAGSSNITNSSCEMIHFNVSNYGTYTIKITRIDSNSNGVKYGLAWW